MAILLLTIQSARYIHGCYKGPLLPINLQTATLEAVSVISVKPPHSLGLLGLPS